MCRCMCIRRWCAVAAPTAAADQVNGTQRALSAHTQSRHHPNAPLVHPTPRREGGSGSITLRAILVLQKLSSYDRWTCGGARCSAWGRTGTAAPGGAAHAGTRPCIYLLHNSKPQEQWQLWLHWGYSETSHTGTCWQVTKCKHAWRSMHALSGRAWRMQALNGAHFKACSVDPCPCTSIAPCDCSQAGLCGSGSVLQSPSHTPSHTAKKGPG